MALATLFSERSPYGAASPARPAHLAMANAASPVTPTIRTATRNDLDALVELETAFPAVDRATRRNWRDLLSGHTLTLVMVSEGTLIGAAAILLREGSDIGRLYTLAIRPEWRGQGLASDLLGAACLAAKSHGCHRIRLEVRASNAIAIQLYKREDFVVIANKPSYYPDGEDALHMEKRLSPNKEQLH